MDAQSQEMFDNIIAMDKDTLTVDQKAFLMARRDYFNDEQRERYADMIEEHEANMDATPLEEMTMKQLKAEAKKLDITVSKDMSEEDIIAAIKEAQA